MTSEVSVKYLCVIWIMTYMTEVVGLGWCFFCCCCFKWTTLELFWVKSVFVGTVPCLCAGFLGERDNWRGCCIVFL